MDNVSLEDGVGDEGIFTSCCSRSGCFVRWSNPIFRGPAETPGRVDQESGASASMRLRARRVVRLGGKAAEMQKLLPGAYFRVDGNETNVSSFSLNN